MLLHLGLLKALIDILNVKLAMLPARCHTEGVHLRDEVPLFAQLLHELLLDLQLGVNSGYLKLCVDELLL